MALVAVTYFATAKIGLSFAEGNDIVSAVWPPSGVGLAAVFMLGYRVLPGIAVAAVFSNFTGDSGLGAAVGISLGNTAAAALGAFLLDRAGFRPDLRRVRDVILLALLGAAVAPALNATVGNATLWVEGRFEASELWEVWRVWWLGDLTGVLLCAPPVLLLLNGIKRQTFALGHVAEATAGLAALTVATILLLREQVTLAYPVFPLLALIAMRYRQPGAVIAAPFVSVICIYFTGQGEGPFVGGSPADELLRAQLFVALAALTALMVAAARTEWERSEGALHALAESRQALAEAQELAHIGSFDWDLASDQVSWTEELYRILGLAPSQPTERYEQYLARVHPDDREMVRNVVDGAVRHRRPFRMEHRIVRPDGEVRHLDARGRFIGGKDGGGTRIIGTAQDVTERREAETQLNFLAMHDPLTGLANRALFLERLSHALDQVGEERRLAVLFCDLDEFKNVNDSLGHETGDQLLAALPPRLERAVRTGDTVARFGGDEFVVLLERLEQETDAIQVAERLREAFAQPIRAGNRTHHVSASIGIVFARAGEMTASEVLRDADAAMYRAKSSGRAEISVFDEPLRTDLVRRIGIENDLRVATAEDQLRLEYQPLHTIESGEIVAVEALVRWQHPVRGLVQPDEFIELAERSGQISELGVWVLNEACAAAASQLKRTHPDLVVSVNLSAAQVSDAYLNQDVEHALEASGLEPGHLALEITESALLEQGPFPVENLNRLRDLGVRLVLDDFGTGYSSLSYLKHIPFDVLKIDREFIAGIGQRREDTAIVEAVVSMSRSLEVVVVAEGVETGAQFEWLRERGVHLGQGFYFTGPLALPDLLPVMERQRKAADPSG